MRRMLALTLVAVLVPAAAVSARPAKTIAHNLRVPWGIAFLPDGSALVSERTTHTIRRIPHSGGRGRVVQTIPDVDTHFGEGGLLGLAVSPRYRQNKQVFAY